MSENKNIIIQQNNRTDYDVLFPKNNSWKKEEVAIAETFQKYGLDANAIPKDLFDYLISQIKSEYGKIYIWKKWQWALNIKRDEPDPNDSISSEISRSYSGNLYFAQFDAVQVQRDGTFIGTPCQVMSKTYQDYFNFPPHYYYSNLFKTYSEAQNSQPLIYAGYNTEGTTETGYGEISYSGAYFTIRKIVSLANRVYKKNENTVQSTNPNAYQENNLPDSEGYFYQKDGEAFNPTFGQVFNSFYTGTGTYSSNKNTINCTGKPIFFFVKRHSGQSGTSSGTDIYVGMSNNSSNYFYSYFNNYNSKNILTWGDNSVSWYCTNNAAFQLNEKDVRYDFIIIQTI